MGFHRLVQRGTHVSFGIMLKFVTIAALATVAASSHEMMKKIHKDMMVMNSMTACWGKGNMMLYKMAIWEATEQCMQENHSNLLKPANPIKSSSSKLSAWSNIWNGRTKRQVDGLLQPTEEDFKEFLADFEDFKGDIASKMGNLTCVMKKMDMLDNNLQVNMKAYSGDMWDKIDLSQTMAGEDPEWRNMLTTHYKDCYDIARSFPQSALNRNPLTKVFGRHMVFFKCAKKVEHKCCAMACANDMLETLYGTNDNYDWTQHGMPQNKYKRAALTLKIMYGTASDEEMAINDFFFGMDM